MYQLPAHMTEEEEGDWSGVVGVSRMVGGGGVDCISNFC